MSVAIRALAAPVSLLVPAVLLAGLTGTILLQTGTLSLAPPQTSVVRVAAPATVTIAARPYAYRATGTFQRSDGAMVDAPLVEVAAPAPLTIMVYLVTNGEYDRCVADAACRPAQGRSRAADVPVTGVSYDDADDYARWLSAATGATWRLPDVAEWAFAAGDRAVDPALGISGDAADPAATWLANYEREAALGSAAAEQPGPAGSGGFNAFGVADLSGPVWEWTASCDGRTTMDPGDTVLTALESCGVRLLEGQHRTPMSSFVRDARTGGCAVGRPPDALGFRLVRERSLMEMLVGS